MESGERLKATVMESGALLSVPQAADVLGVSTATIRRMINGGELPAAQLGGRAHRPLRISAANLNQAVRGWTTR
jgi:excisionase family DNA binding protein